MVKKTSQSFESRNSDVWARSLAQITILGPYEQNTDAKSRNFYEFSFWAHEPLEMVKKNM